MKIISVVSSGRKDGNSARISGLLETELESIGKLKGTEVLVERITPAHLDIKMCLGCRACFNKGETFCPLKDDLLSVKEKMMEADGIIFGSPVYVEDVNGVMKNLIDRLAFNSHRPGFAGKVAFLYVTSGAGTSNHSVRTMKTALGSWGFYIVGSRRFRAGGSTAKEELEKKYGRYIKKSARQLFDAIYTNRSSKPTFFSLIAFTVQQTSWMRDGIDKNSIDYKYWHDNGWLDKSRWYYFKHGANPLKTGLCRLAGKIVAIFLV